MTACPACGVAVVPGYVRCPKCHAALPRRHPTLSSGGTALPDRRRFPLVAVVGVAVVGAIVIIYFGVRRGSPPAKAQPPAPAAIAPAPVATPPPAPEPAPPAAAPRGPDPQTLANNLERALRKQRLWSTVTIVGARVEVRSGSCADPAMKPALDAAAASFRTAGLTKLRCLEQSGRIVTDREL